jgi:hypothetical protein
MRGLRHPVDPGAQNDLIGAPEPMSIEAVLAALNECLFASRGFLPTV